MVRFILLVIVLLIPLTSTYCQRTFSYSTPGRIPVPVVFADGIISTGDYDSHPAFSPSGDTLFFIKCSPDFATWTICVSYFRNQAWTSPEVASFSGKYKEADPFFTKDGNTLYYISTRPVKDGVEKKDSDIWKVVKTKSGWSEPIHLDEPINSDGMEYYPTLSDKGTLYFGSDRSGGKGNTDIYYSVLTQKKYVTVENAGEGINTEADEYEPFVSPDERYLIFMSAASGRGDLYVSYSENHRWAPSAKLPEPINSEATEYSPKVTRDGKYFFFSSTRNKYKHPLPVAEDYKTLHQRFTSSGNGLGDIYQVDINSLKLKSD